MPDMEFVSDSEPESESGPIFSTVWALIMPPFDESPEENWAIATSDEDGRCWIWWELVKVDTGGFASQRNVSDEAPHTASQIYLGEISRLDAFEMGQNMPRKVTNRLRPHQDCEKASVGLFFSDLVVAASFRRISCADCQDGFQY